MNYTQNHHLPQWVKSDRVRMEDFNQMSKDIEAGLDAANASAASAKSTANSALVKANAAYAPGNLPYVIGTYTGDGSNQIIDLGFMPSFLIVSGMQGSNDASDTQPFDRYFAIIGSNGDIIGQQLQYRLQLLTYGFAAYKVGNQGSQLPVLNEKGRKYYYIAFR